MPVGDVLALSESDGEGVDLIPEPPPVPRKKRKQLRLDGRANKTGSSVDPETRLRGILGKRCRCKKRDCFRSFAGEEEFKQLLAYRTTYFSLHKLDQDHHAASHRLEHFFLSRFCVCFRLLNAKRYPLLETQALHKIRDLMREDQTSVSWSLLGRRLCLRSWKTLHGMGRPP